MTSQETVGSQVSILIDEDSSEPKRIKKSYQKAGKLFDKYRVDLNYLSQEQNVPRKKLAKLPKPPASMQAPAIIQPPEMILPMLQCPDVPSKLNFMG